MMFSDGGKHVWLAIAATEGLLSHKPTTKIAKIVQTNHEGTTRTGDIQTATAVSTTAHTRPANMVLPHPHQPPRLPHQLRGSDSWQRTIPAEIPTRANQTPSAPATDSTTAVRHARPFRRRHCRGHHLWFRKMLDCLSFALLVARHNYSVKISRAPTLSADDLHKVIPAVGISAPSIPPPSQVTFSTNGVRGHSDAPLDHGLSSAKRTRAPSAVTPCRGSNSTMVARAPNAAHLNHDTGTCTSHAPPRRLRRRCVALIRERVRLQFFLIEKGRLV